MSDNESETESTMTSNPSAISTMTNDPTVAPSNDGDVYLDNGQAATADFDENLPELSEEMQEAANELVQFGLQQIQSAATEVAAAGPDSPIDTARITVAQYEVGFIAAVITKPDVPASGIAAASATAFRADTVFVVAHHDVVDLRPEDPQYLNRELICVAIDRELGAVELAVAYGFEDGELQFGEGVVRPQDFSDAGMRIAGAVHDVLSKPYEELPDWIIMEDYYKGVADTFTTYGLKVLLETDL